MSKKVNHYQQKYLLIKWKSQIFYLYLKAVKICCIQIVITIEYYTIESKYFRSLKKIFVTVFRTQPRISVKNKNIMSQSKIICSYKNRRV